MMTTLPAASTLRAGAIHDRIVQPRVPGVEVHPVASEAEHAQDVPALAAVLATNSGQCRHRGLRHLSIAGLGPLCCGGHGQPPFCPSGWNAAREARRAGLSERTAQSNVFRPAHSDLAGSLIRSSESIAFPHGSAILRSPGPF